MIASGKKTIEVRKTLPKIDTPFKCYIYETQGKTETPWMDEDGHLIFKGRGMVIGEFVCDTVYSIDAEHVPALKDAFHGISCDDFLRKSCLSAYDLLDYLTASERQISIEYRPGYGWHITDLVIYGEPKPLTDFYKWWDDGDDIRPCQNGRKCVHEFSDYGENCMACAIDYDGTDCPYLKLQRAPQSWCYVEET